MSQAQRKRYPRVWLVGGEDIHLRLPFVKALRDRGIEIGVCGTMSGDLFRDAGITFSSYSLSRKLAPLADVRSLTQLRRLFAGGKPDIVHGFDTKPALLAPLAARAERVPIAMRSITGLGSIFSSTNFRARLLQIAYRSLQRYVRSACRMTVFQNSDDQEYFLAHKLVDDRKQALIAGSGVDVDAFAAAAAKSRAGPIRQELGMGDRVVCLMVARLVREKGVSEFLDAARIVRQTCPEAAFVLVGPSDTRGPNAVPKEEVREYEEAVLYLGPRADVAELLGVADVFVLPTRYREGVPRTLLEAGAAGLPLVTTDMPGCRDVVQDGWNGFVVEPGSSYGLASALVRLIKEPDLRRDMGERAAQRTRARFDISLVTNAYADLYLRLWDEVRND